MPRLRRMEAAARFLRQERAGRHAVLQHRPHHAPRPGRQARGGQSGRRVFAVQRREAGQDAAGDWPAVL